MNLLERGLVSVFEKRASGETSLMPSLFSFGSFASTAAGRKVNRNTSLKISAFYCALTTLAESFALLPKAVYQVQGENRNRLPDHPLDYVLHDEAHNYMTAFMFNYIMVLSLFVKGNAYAYIMRNNSGNIIGLQYWDADKVEVVESNGKLFYKYNNKTYGAAEVFHVPGFCFNGIVGQSIVHFAADSMGTPLAAQEYGANSYNEKGVSLGVLETDLSVKPEAKKAIKEAWTAGLSGNDPHRAVVLDEGFKYSSIRLSPDQSKFIEAKVEGTGDIARWFKIPLHMLHVTGEGGYNFLVQMSISYLQHAVQPIAEKFKQESNRKLLTRTERQNGLYINYNYKKLLQVDPKSRSEFYKNMIMMKAMTPNEIRDLEDMNPYKGGDEPLQMVNMQTLTQIEKSLEDEGSK